VTTSAFSESRPTVCVSASILSTGDAIYAWIILHAMQSYLLSLFLLTDRS
jgi:hypothetical protein